MFSKLLVVRVPLKQFFNFNRYSTELGSLEFTTLEITLCIVEYRVYVFPSISILFSKAAPDGL